MSLPRSHSTPLPRKTGSQEFAAPGSTTNSRRFEPLAGDTDAAHPNPAQQPQATIRLYIGHIFLVVIYISITSKTTKPFWLDVVGWVTIGLFLIVTGLMLYLHFSHAHRNKLQYVRAFAVCFITLCLTARRILPDTVGLAMISVTFVITFPELKGNILAVLGGDRPPGGILPL